jgi:hypothetical protein
MILSRRKLFLKLAEREGFEPSDVKKPKEIRGLFSREGRKSAFRVGTFVGSYAPNRGR